jgi:hypothetical protein
LTTDLNGENWVPVKVSKQYIVTVEVRLTSQRITAASEAEAEKWARKNFPETDLWDSEILGEYEVAEVGDADEDKTSG